MVDVTTGEDAHSLRRLKFIQTNSAVIRVTAHAVLVTRPVRSRFTACRVLRRGAQTIEDDERDASGWGARMCSVGDLMDLVLITHAMRGAHTKQEMDTTSHCTQHDKRDRDTKHDERGAEEEVVGLGE